MMKSIYIKVLSAVVFSCFITMIQAQNRASNGQINRIPGTSECLNLDFIDGLNNWKAFYSNEYNNPDQFQTALIGNGYGTDYPNDPEDTSRHLVINRADFEQFDKVELSNKFIDLGPTPMVEKIAKLGNSHGTGRSESLERSFNVKDGKNKIGFHYAVVFSNYDMHSFQEAMFEIVFLDSQGDTCVDPYGIKLIKKISVGDNNAGLRSAKARRYLPWTSDIVDLSLYNGNYVTIKLVTKDCEDDPHFGLAYFSGFCDEGVTQLIDADYCPGFNTINALLTDRCGTGDYKELCDIYWEGINVVSIGDGPNKDDITYYAPYNSNSKTLTIQSSKGDSLTVHKYYFTQGNCPDSLLPCAAFTLQENQKYLLSYWVKNEELVTNTMFRKTFERGDGNIFLDLISEKNETVGPFVPEIIRYNQWQKMDVTFTIPENTWDINVRFANLGEGITLFDDVRIIPFNANAVGYVYDPTTRKLIAELDKNNYATFYEYDEEGNLKRIKKETERGIKTIKESRRELVKPSQTTITDGDSGINNNLLNSK